MTTKTFALNHELSALPEGDTEAGVPHCVQLIPASRTALIQGRDGRAWHNSHPEAIVDAFNQRGADLPIDIEHSSELKAKQGEPAPAVGWIKALEARDEGAIWGLVEWTEQGQQLIRDKAYRYLSPVFAFNAESQQILQLHSAGLTNQPNLPLTALNQQQGENTMSLNIALCRALNLPEASTDETIIATAQERFTETEPTSLEAMVPRADYDLALNRAQAAEAKVQHIEEEQQQAAIELAINQALEQGVITPATADYHRACCRQAGGLEQFQDFVSKAPKVVSDVAFNHANIDDHGLTDDERLVCELLGVNEDIFQQKEAN